MEEWPSFAMLEDVAFLVWCSKTAPVSPRAAELLQEKGEKAEAWQSPAEPRGAQATAAVTAAAIGAAAGTTKLSSPTSTTSGSGGGSSDLLQSPVRSH